MVCGGERSRHCTRRGRAGNECHPPRAFGRVPRRPGANPFRLRRPATVTGAARSSVGRPVTSIRLTPAERQDLLDHYRRSADPDVGHRAHILLLLDAGHPWATISAVLFCSTSTISRWKRRFEKEGVDAVFGRPRGRRRSGIHVWATLVVRWVHAFPSTQHTRMWRRAPVYGSGVCSARSGCRTWSGSCGTSHPEPEFRHIVEVTANCFHRSFHRPVMVSCGLMRVRGRTPTRDGWDEPQMYKRLGTRRGRLRWNDRAPRVGFEPTTRRLTAGCSTASGTPDSSGIIGFYHTRATLQGPTSVANNHIESA